MDIKSEPALRVILTYFYFILFFAVFFVQRLFMCYLNVLFK